MIDQLSEVFSWTLGGIFLSAIYFLGYFFGSKAGFKEGQRANARTNERRAVAQCQQRIL